MEHDAMDGQQLSTYQGPTCLPSQYIGTGVPDSQTAQLE